MHIPGIVELVLYFLSIEKFLSEIIFNMQWIIEVNDKSDVS